MERKAMGKREFSIQQYGCKSFAQKYYELIKNPEAQRELFEDAKYKKTSKILTPGQQDVFIKYLG